MPSKKAKVLSFLFSLYFFPVLFLLLLVSVSLYQGSSIGQFTRDPTATAGISPFSGIASHFGVLLLIASGAICLFSWAILRNSSVRKISIFFFCSGIMSILLGLDDLLLLHESVYPRFLGVNEKIVVTIYALLALGGIVRFRKEILQTEYSIMILAILFFGMSIIVDNSQEEVESIVGQWRIFFEDGFKFLGIVAWFGYYLRSCLAATKLKPNVNSC